MDGTKVVLQPSQAALLRAAMAGDDKVLMYGEDIGSLGGVFRVTEHLLDDLVTSAPPKNREVEAAKARARAQARYA